MKYLCLVCFEAKDFDALVRAGKLDELDRASLAYNDELQRRGQFVHAEALRAPDSAITVRAREGRVSATDGPFAETKEQIAGFILVEARDLNEAVQLAAGIPLAKIGAIEVRPILDLQDPAVREAHVAGAELEPTAPP